MNKKKIIIFLSMCICIILKFASITNIDFEDRPIIISDIGNVDNHSFAAAHYFKGNL